MESGLSKWTNERKEATKEGTIYVESRPILCDCGGSSPIGGDGGAVASFFYINNEWICTSCGRVFEPPPPQIQPET